MTPSVEEVEEQTEGVLAPGTVIAERYRIERLLGEGGMGAVYLAEHVHMRKQLAVKVLHAEVGATPELVARFEREAIAAGHIAHSNVAAATDFGRLEDGSFFLVLEFVAGRSLRQVIGGYDDERGREAGAPLDPMRALRIVRGIARGVAAAHEKGIVHRDLKPENVMLVDPGDGQPPGGDGSAVKVLDFGIAKLDPVAVGGADAGAQPLTRMGAVFGTPDYMSPEQALGRPVDRRSDLYAIGIILFELLTGDRPFRGGAVTVLRQQVLEDAPPLPESLAVDPRVASIVRRLLAKSPEARFDSATELAEALDEVLATPAPASAPHAAGRTPTAYGRAAGPTSTAEARALALQPTMMVGVADATAGGVVPAPGKLPLTSPKVLAIALGLFVGLLLLAGIILVAGHSDDTATKAPDQPSGDAEPQEDTWTAEAWGAASAVSTVPPPPPVQLPPPPSPSPARAASPTPSSAASSSTGAKRSKGRGGGGIHIPPPSQWF
jgi:serine/threonine-protein kinase